MNRIITLLFIFTFLFIQQINSQNAEPSDVLRAPHATIEFEQDEFNYGTITQGEKVKNVFVFTNTSDAPLIISNAKGSCGCTVPEWPKEPIMPGESSQLLVVFDSKGKKGSQAKRVTIIANTEVATTFLVIKGIVEIEESKKVEAPENRSVNEDFFNIHPNPTSERVNISLNDYIGERTIIEVFDRSGKLMTTKSIGQIEEKTYSIELNNYTSGIYTAAIIVGDKMRLAKQFVVQ